MTEESQNKTNFSPESHAFNVSVAEKYGIEEAIFINHFAFWIKGNTNNKNNFIDGKVWMYQTYEEILYHFPYFKNKQKVIRTIQSLVDQKVIVKKSFNKCKFDRTNWFTFISPEIFVSNYKIMDLEGCTENGLSMNHEKRFLDTSKRFLDVPKMDHQIVRKWTIRESENGPPIPDNKTYNKTTTSLIDDTCEDESCFFAVAASLPIEKATATAAIEKPAILDKELKAKTAVALFAKVDKNLDADALSQARQAIEIALESYEEQVVLMSIEDMNAKKEGEIRSWRALFPHICSGNKLKGPRKIVDQSQLEKRMLFAKYLESKSTCGGSYCYDKEKLYFTSGTLPQAYTFAGNDDFWSKIEKFCREDYKKTTSKAI